MSLPQDSKVAPSPIDFCLVKGLEDNPAKATIAWEHSLGKSEVKYCLKQNLNTCYDAPVLILTVLWQQEDILSCRSWTASPASSRSVEFEVWDCRDLLGLVQKSKLKMSSVSWKKLKILFHNDRWDLAPITGLERKQWVDLYTTVRTLASPFGLWEVKLKRQTGYY